MTKPLALICYNNLVPGSQLANRLHELGYRVQTVENSALGELPQVAEREKPILLVAEVSNQTGVCAAIAALKANSATQHIPVLAFAADADKVLQATAKKSGASLLASNKALLDQLPQLLDQILQVE